MFNTGFDRITEVASPLIAAMRCYEIQSIVAVLAMETEEHGIIGYHRNLLVHDEIKGMSAQLSFMISRRPGDNPNDEDGTVSNDDQSRCSRTNNIEKHNYSCLLKETQRSRVRKRPCVAKFNQHVSWLLKEVLLEGEVCYKSNVPRDSGMVCARGPTKNGIVRLYSGNNVFGGMKGRGSFGGSGLWVVFRTGLKIIFFSTQRPDPFIPSLFGSLMYLYDFILSPLKPFANGPGTARSWFEEAEDAEGQNQPK